MQVQVLVPTGVDYPFSYETEKPVTVGQIVFVPFRKTVSLGVVWSDASSGYKGLSKDLSDITDFTLSQEMLAFVDWVSDYTMNQKG